MSEREPPLTVRSALEELKQALARLYGERFLGLYLYGSYARGTATNDSDVDVLVVLEGDVKPGAEITRIAPLASEICLRHDLLIATFPISSEWLDTRQTSFMLNVRREGVLI